MSSKTRALLGVIIVAMAASRVLAQEYDLVIRNGRVMDPETSYDAVANVGLRNGRIAIITKDPISGHGEIDATGLVVAPGFIDGHFHAVDPYATKLAVQDGVTTGMDLEAGTSDVGDWYAKKDASGWQINYGTTANLAAIRMKLHDPEVTYEGAADTSTLNKYIEQAAKDGEAGWSVNRSNVETLNTILSILDEDLRQGAIGVGVPAAYMQRGLSSYEQFEVQRTAARYGRLAAVHTRYHLNGETPTEAPIAFDEVLTNAMLLDAPLLLAHDNDYGWWENEEKLQMARAKGYNVWGEYYPFIAGATFVSATFLQPAMWEAVNGYKYEETIFDPATDSFLTKEQYLHYAENDPGRAIVAFIPKRKDWMKYWLTMPHMVVGSDAMPGFGTSGELLPYEASETEYAGHPRTVSSFAKTLKLAREQNVPLMFTLAQLSFWSAKHLGDTGLEAMRERGRLQVGKVADITIFDPEAVAPRASYKLGENGLTSVGIPWVIVNGTIVVRDSEVQNVRPGQPIRFPVEDRGRHVPLNWARWVDEHTIFPVGGVEQQEPLVDPRAAH